MITCVLYLGLAIKNAKGNTKIANTVSLKSYLKISCLRKLQKILKSLVA